MRTYLLAITLLFTGGTLLASAGLLTGLWTLFPPGLGPEADLEEPLTELSPDEPYHPYLPPFFTGAISLGTTNHGRLLRAAELPLDHPTLQVMPRQRARQLHYGASGLIQALVESADKVAADFPGSILCLGDIAAQEGGDIPWSVSHNNGRDADLAFFYQDNQGQPLVPDDFITLTSTGRSRDRQARLDIPRTWALIQALLESPHIRVQWLFIYGPLRDQLLRHALEIGAPEPLLTQAREVLGQPSDGAPHNDHLHLRVMCGDDELREGCRDAGRIPSFVPDPGILVAERIQAVRQLLSHPEPERRARACALLGLLGAASAAPELLSRLSDPSPRVRAAAARGLETLSLEGPNPLIPEEPGSDQGLLGSSLTAPWLQTLLTRLPTESDPAVLEIWLGVLLRQQAQGLAPLLFHWLDDPRVLQAEARGTLPDSGLPRDEVGGLPWLASRGAPLDQPLPIRALAAIGLEELEAADAVPRLVSMLGDPDPTVRQSLIQALDGLTNRPPQPGDSVEALAAAYPAWLQAHGAEGRDAWLLQGFNAAGFPLTRLDVSAGSSLIKALASPAPTCLNAFRLLCRLTGERPVLGVRPADSSHVFQRWLRRHPPASAPRAPSPRRRR